MSYIQGKDTIRGTDGEVILKVNGEEHNFIHLTQLTITGELDEDEVVRIGTRTKGHKTNTIGFSASGTGYYGDPTIRKAMLNYINGGSYPEMEILLTNYDPETQAQLQTLVCTGVKCTSFVLGEIDASANMLEEDFDFTIENVQIKDHFSDTIGAEGGLEIGSLERA